MSASVKSILNCIGMNPSGNVSVLRNLFGFRNSRVPQTRCSSDTGSVNLLTQVVRLRNKHVHLNVIRVGVDNFDANDHDKIDYALYRCHKIFNTRSLGVGRIKFYSVSAADSNGKADIGSEDEAEDLTQDWTVDNNGIDVFVVENISDTDFVGLSPRPGPCDKDAKGMNGVLAGEVSRGHTGFARTFAHEIGHYLGLPHQNSSPTNLMCQTSQASSICDSVVLTSSQGNTIRSHCFVRNGC